MRKRHVSVLLGITCLLIGGCGGSDEAASSGPEHAECKKPPTATVDKITATFVAPVEVATAYQVKDTETPGYVAVVVGTDGLPEGVPHKDEEIPAPGYALYKGKLYTADGQAIRYSGDSLPNVNDNPDLIGAAYNPSNGLAFECVKAEL
jgi:hypothetical protein